MKLRRYIVFVMVSLIVLFSANAKTKTETTDFSLVFKKPPRDTFFFSDPDSIDHAPFESSKGLVFPLPEDNVDAGYPSCAYIGITFELQSKATIKVYANSLKDLTGTSTLKGVKTDRSLNYEIGFVVFDNDVATAKNEALSKCAVLKDPKNAFLTINSRSEGPEGLSGDVANLDSGTIIICFRVTSPVNNGSHVYYFEDQYNGYVKMVFESI